MAILVESILALTWSGIWKPSEWRELKTYIYTVYTIVVVFVVYGFLLSGVLDLFINASSINDIINNIFFLLSMVTVCTKIFVILYSHKDIENIRQNFRDGWVNSDSFDEIIIQMQYDHTIRFYFFVCVVLYELTGSAFPLGRLYAMRQTNELPYRSFLPYNHTTPIAYQVTAALQCSAIFFAANVCIGCDTLFPGLMLQLCAAISVLKRRFQLTMINLQKNRDNETCDENEYRKIERQLLGNWIKSHNAILSLACYIESVFSKVILTQYSVGAFVLCTTVYLMSQMQIYTMDFLGMFMYLICMFIQIFIYCFSAHLVTLEFSDLGWAIYSSEWFGLSVPVKKNMIFMIAKTLRPFEFSSGYMVTLSLDSFTSLIKLAYSTYNLLKTA